MTSKTEIFYPLLIKNDSHIVFGTKDSGERAVVGYLFDYDLNTKRLIKIFNEPIRLMEKPAIASDGSILVTVVEFNDTHFPIGNTITLLSPGGKKESLFDGLNPVWLVDGRSFYYYDRHQKILTYYDLSTRMKQRIASTESLMYLVLSPDKKYLTFNEGIPIWAGSQDWRLTVMTADGWVKKAVKPDGERSIHSFGGLDWSE
jgi:hypothetical protein